MIKTNLSFLTVVLLLLFLVSCQHEEQMQYKVHCNNSVSDTKTVVLSDAANYCKEVSDFIGTSLDDHESRVALMNFIKDNGGLFETITLKDIFHSKKTLSASSIYNAEIVASKLLTTFLDSSKKYASSFIDESVSKSVSYISKSEVIDIISSMDVELYMPNSENFEPEREESLTIGFSKVEQDDYTDGIKYIDTSSEYVPYIDEEYLLSNMTLLVLPKDKTNYTPSYSISDTSLFSNNATLKSNEVLISDNIHESKIDRKDILKVTVGAVRVHGTDWCGAISNKLKLKLFRAFPVSHSESSNYMVFSIEISKKELKRADWRVLNCIFDDNWTWNEFNQELLFYSQHNLGGDLTVNGSVDFRFDDGKLKIGIPFSIKLGGAKLRANNPIDRDDFLWTNINYDFGAGLYNMDGVNYSVRRFGIADFVLRAYHISY